MVSSICVIFYVLISMNWREQCIYYSLRYLDPQIPINDVMKEMKNTVHITWKLTYCMCRLALTFSCLLPLRSWTWPNSWFWSHSQSLRLFWRMNATQPYFSIIPNHIGKGWEKLHQLHLNYYWKLCIFRIKDALEQIAQMKVQIQKIQELPKKNYDWKTIYPFWYFYLV